MKQGWEVKKLGDVCEFENGDRGSNYPSKAHRTQTGIPFINAGHLSENGVDFIDMDYISQERYNLLGSGKIKENDILFCLRGSLGKFASVKNLEKGAIASSLVILRIKTSVLHNYLLAYLGSNICVDMINKYKGGAAQPNLSAGSLKNFTIPIPPLAEQERIVAILDKAFSAIEQAKQNAEKNLKNAKELFDSYLNGIFTNKGDDWEEKPLNEIAEYFNGLTYSPKDVSGSGILVLRSSNIQNDELDFNDNVYVNLTVKDKIKVKENDILMCSRNGSKRLVGKTAKIQALEEEMTFGTFMMIIRSENHEILSWFFKSVNFKEQISQGENTMINQITRYMLDDVVISMPRNRETQIKISNHLRILQLHIKDLETIFKQKINELEELKKSILQKAFNGELV